MDNHTAQAVLRDLKAISWRNWKINKKTNWFMNKKEKLQALEVFDDFMSEDDEENDENDSQVWIKYSNIAVFCIYSLAKRL